MLSRNRACGAYKTFYKVMFCKQTGSFIKQYPKVPMKQNSKEPLMSGVTGKAFCPKIPKKALLVAGRLSFFLPTTPALHFLSLPFTDITD